MSFIVALQEYLQGYKYMNAYPFGQILTDVIGETLPSCGITCMPKKDCKSVQEETIGENIIDIFGSRSFEIDYVFYAKRSLADEQCRQKNNELMEGLMCWINEQNSVGNLPVLLGGYETESIKTSSYWLREIQQECIGLYQMQIKLEIKRGETKSWEQK